MGMIIEGISREDHKKLYDAIEKQGNAYGLARIKIKTVPSGFMLSPNFSSLSISDEMPEIFNKRELEAAVSHELSHVYHHDPGKDMVMAVPFILLAVLQPILARYYVNNDLYAYIWITPVLLAIVYLILCVVVLHKWDMRSDRDAAAKTSVQAMIDMLEKRKQHVKGFDPLHPSVDKRIKRLKDAVIKEKYEK